LIELSKQQWQSKDEFTRPKYQVQLSDTGEEMITITHVVQTIKMSDVEDPDLLVAEPIYKWQQTEAGKWIMENSNPTPSWHRNHDIYNYGYNYQIRAYLTPKQITYYELKFK
jgi:hypothetical protein